MQDAKTDAIAQEARTSVAIEGIGDLAGGVPADLAMPGEIDFTLAASHIEPEPERVGLDFGSEV